MFRGTEHLGSGSLYSNTVWVVILAVFWTIAWVIAEAIPSFNHLLALIVSYNPSVVTIYGSSPTGFIQSSLFVSWFTYGISGAMWLHINKGRWFENWKKTTLTIINFSICGMGIIIVSANS